MAGSAALIDDRKIVLDDGAIIQIRIWRLPEQTRERPHGLKYSLFYGRPASGSSATTTKLEKAIIGTTVKSRSHTFSSASRG